MSPKRPMGGIPIRCCAPCCQYRLLRRLLHHLLRQTPPRESWDTAPDIRECRLDEATDQGCPPASPEHPRRDCPHRSCDFRSARDSGLCRLAFKGAEPSRPLDEGPSERRRRWRRRNLASARKTTFCVSLALRSSWRCFCMIVSPAPGRAIRVRTAARAYALPCFWRGADCTAFSA